MGEGDQRRYRIGDVAYDRAHDLLYVLEYLADDGKPVVHVWRVGGGAPPSAVLLSNISTRGWVGTGDNVMIGGAVTFRPRLAPPVDKSPARPGGNKCAGCDPCTTFP